MKTLYLECKMGAAGDMLMGALLELVQDMPVIKTVLLRPEDVCARLCGDETPAPSLLRRSALALAALRQSLQACLSTRGDVE